MADQYAYNASGYRQRYYHSQAAANRFHVVQRNGRIVVEEVV